MNYARNPRQHSHKNNRRRSPAAGIWTSTVLPTLAIVLTTATLLVQHFEKKTEAKAQQQSQWMTALEKLPDPQIVGMLEMEPFFRDPHGPLARALAAQKMSSIPDHSMFDIVFADFIRQGGDHDQMSLIILARSLTSQLRSQYKTHKRIVPRKIEDCGRKSSFELFLANTDCFYDENKLDDLEDEARAESLTWELDTVVEKLVSLWTNPNAPQPPTRDLEGIAFFSSNQRNYRATDFTKSDLDHSGFYGACDVSGAKFEPKVKSSEDGYIYCQSNNPTNIALLQGPW